jgi:2,4-dienoyl-CoA reductase-like NADH-dependent reductase (Old Yellow Enzyme family)
MRNKLFTPINIGAFDLQHRLVLEWPLATDPLDSATNQLVSSSAPLLSGGLVIHDPGPLIWPGRAPQTLSEVERINSVWRNVMHNAKVSRQSSLARLRGGPAFQAADQPNGILALTPGDIEKIIGDYVDAAYRVKSNGFDGIELDGSFGSIADLFLMPSTNLRSDRYGGPIVQRLNFVLELVEALTRAFGRDRVGIRLSPFPNGFEEVRSKVYHDVLSSLHDQEIAYIHLELAEYFDAQLLNSAPPAKALRRAYPGILVTSGQQGLQFAMELVESRWADAVCFFSPLVDAQFLSQLRQAQLDDPDPLY